MRDFLLIGGMVLVAILVGGVLFFFGPASLQSDVNSAISANGGSTSTSTVSYTVLVQGTNALSVTGRSNYRIRTNDDLKTLWVLIYGDHGVSAIPTVDFSKYEVLAIFDGTHSNGGYTVQVKSLTDANAQRLVVVDHVTPGSTCVTTSSITSPFQLIQVPKTTFPLTHTDETRVSACP
ncbi:protease complex subunit PrcB family protein [Patescibacteria group bacterium]|nr:protease complex subunit PrcB family protein [Patescibacteria group bacterium]